MIGKIAKMLVMGWLAKRSGLGRMAASGGVKGLALRALLKRLRL